MQITVDLAALARAVLWPLIAVAVLMAYRKSIADTLTSIGPKIKSIKVGEFSIDLASVEARELREPGWSGGAVDLRHAGRADADISDSTLMTFVSQVRQTSRMDYAIVDLGTGQNWLTSRLFILSVVLRRMRGLAVFVFVDSTEHVSRRYVGMAACDQVRWRLAQRFPEFERALANAAVSINLAAQIVDDHGRLGLTFDPSNPSPAVDLMRGYLTAVQQPMPPLPGDTAEWVSLPAQQPGMAPIFERARWLSRAGLEDLLRDLLQQTHLKLEDIQPLDDAGRAKAVIRHDGHYVAITRDERVFHRLINRDSLVETAAKGAVMSTPVAAH
jgi:hypothetical protein